MEYADPNFGMFLQYISIYFLAEVRGFYRALEIINEDREELKTILMLVGELDACQALASFRTFLDYYCEPQFELEPNITDARINGRELYHPLLSKPVSNSLNIHSKSVLITGSNMSGKSTFLKTIGLNALFAQMIYMHC